VLDDGRLTDNKGRTANFRNTIIIMTSNIGAELIRENYENLNIENHDTVLAKTKLEVFEMLKRSVRPEFLNRIDELIMFEPLSRENIRAIADIQFKELYDRMNYAGYKVVISDDALDWLAQLGYDPQFGARPLKRVIQKKIMDELSKEILSGRIAPTDEIQINLKDNQMEFNNSQTIKA
ncbi:MAG: AAA family ATPase, partial [Bacteroidia bacterium]